MKKNLDYLIRGLIKKLNIRFSFVETSSTVADAIRIHSADPLSALVFGKSLTVAALMSPLLNGEEKYSLKWEYSGLLGSIIADVNADCDVRGIPKETVLMDKVATNEELYGDSGTITLIKAENGKILNSGTAPAGLLEVADDIAFFMATSDQIETEFLISSSFNPDPENPVNIFAGLMIQAMPGCDLKEFDKLRENLQLGNAMSVLNAKDIPVEKKLLTLISSILGEDMPLNELKEKYSVSYDFAPSPSYTCSCSREKMKAAIMLLEKDEIREMFEKNEHPKIVCQFCKTEYTFGPEEFSL